ncbi:MAG: anti-sigma factor [Bacteroidota bacterium]|nr:anti-sigma factor [Bacteroidota bacterium]
MNINDIISSGLLELYALGLTSSEETAQVQGWINQYPEVKQELVDIQMSIESYAQAHAVEPSASVKDKILSQISADDSDNKLTFSKNENDVPEIATYRIPSFMKIAAAAMLILLIGSLILNYSYYQKYQSANDDLTAAQQKIARQDAANTAMNRDIDVMTDKNSKPVVLNGTPHAPEALAKIFWMRNTGDVYIDPSYLPAVPAGKQYQLWAIVDGKPVSGGMISTEKGTYHIQKMKSFGKADAFAITLEKAGGSPTPTMEEMVVISKI